jgi:hypothetical protein
MMAVHDFPRCSAYLKGMGIRLHDPEMQDKHFAWLLGDAAFSEDELDDMGAKGLPSWEWGQVLPAMERRFEERGRSRRNKPKLSTEQWNRLHGMMACYGLKGSRLKGSKNCIEAAQALWPEDIPKSADARRVFEILNAMPKKQRSRVARSNLENVPKRFFGDGS